MVAALGRDVVAVDADATNLELVRKSLELINKQPTTKLIYNSVSDDYETLYPGGTWMKTWKQVQQKNIKITLVALIIFLLT